MANMQSFYLEHSSGFHTVEPQKIWKHYTADYYKITDSIDQEKTDIAAVAREVFPDHTDEGAQSQLRKILNGERPMTEPIAEKLRSLIAKGQVAVK